MPDPSGIINPFSGRWIARVRNNIICQGGSANQVFRAAKSIRSKEKIIISYIPLDQIMTFQQIFYRIQDILSEEKGVFLVGGAVRNALLGLEAHDLDFAVEFEPEKLARKVCRELQASFFPLDVERETFRLISKEEDGQQIYIDFVRMRRGSIDADLEDRDYTVNAMAVNLNDPQKLIDPMGGAQDLKEKVIRSCTPRSIQDDPIRILRGIRFAAEGGYSIADDTRQQMKVSVSLLTLVSPERKRDELFKIMQLDQLPAAIRALEWLGALPVLFPGFDTLPAQPAQENLKHKTHLDFSSLSNISQLIKVITRQNLEGEGENLFTGMAGSVLNGFRSLLKDYLLFKLTPDRNVYQLIQFSNLIINLARNQKQKFGSILNIINDWNFSKEESHFIHILSQQDPEEAFGWFCGSVNRRDAYLYFKTYGSAGIANSLIKMGNLMAVSNNQPDQDEWQLLLDQVFVLWDAWWNHAFDIVNPATLLNGDEISLRFKLPPGPLIGKCLEFIKEEQASSGIDNKEDAILLMQKFLNDQV